MMKLTQRRSIIKSYPVEESTNISDEHHENSLNAFVSKVDCSDEETDCNLTSSIDCPRTIDDFLEHAYNDHCGDYSRSWCDKMQVGARWKYWMMFLILGLANIGDATEYASIGFLLADKDFQHDILNDNTKSDGLLASVALMGLIIGGLVTGVYEDLLGRKRTLLLGLGFNFLGGVLSIFAFNVKMIAMFRFISGLGIGAILSSLSALSSELAPSSKRGLFVGFVSSFWTIGTVGISLLAMLFFGKLDLSWRYFVAACAIPPCLCFIFVLVYVPESPRFLLVHGKYLKGLENANLIATKKLGYTGALLTLEEVHQQTRHDFESNIEISLSGSTSLQDQRKKNISESTKEAYSNIVALYSNPNVRKNVIAVMILWSCISAGSIGIYITKIYEEIGITNIYESTLFFSLACVPGHVISTLLVDRVGRKTIFSCGMIFSAITLMYFSWLSASDRQSHSFQIIATSCMYSVCNSAAWGSLGVMIGEVFPTKVRSTAIGICGTVARLSNITVQLVYGFLINKPHVLLLVASAFMTLGAIATACTGIDEMAQEPLQDATTERLEGRHINGHIIEDIELVGKQQSGKEVGQIRRKSYTQLSVDGEND